MKFIHWILFLAVFSSSLAAVAPKKAAPNKGVPAKKTAAKTAVRTRGAPAAKSTGARSTTRSTKGKGPARPVASTWHSRQAVPTPERYKEIQDALVQKGYLHSEANGVWNPESTDALKRYQNENNLSPTGKLSSASLISLGLGPKNGIDPVSIPLPAKEPSAPNPESPRPEVHR
jgi:hypothetical protein